MSLNNSSGIFVKATRHLIQQKYQLSKVDALLQDKIKESLKNKLTYS